MVDHTYLLGDTRANKIAAEWFGCKETAGYGNSTELAKQAAAANDKRAHVIALGALLAGYEKAAGDGAWRQNGDTSSTGHYLRYLATSGYTLSDVETYAASPESAWSTAGGLDGLPAHLPTGTSANESRQIGRPGGATLEPAPVVGKSRPLRGMSALRNRLCGSPAARLESARNPSWTQPMTRMRVLLKKRTTQTRKRFRRLWMRRWLTPRGTLSTNRLSSTLLTLR